MSGTPILWLFAAAVQSLAAKPLTSQPAAPDAAATQPSGSVAILMLKAEEPDISDQRSEGGILIREIIRQGLLIAGRDGLGLATRDMALREPFPPEMARSHPPLAIRTAAINDRAVVITTSRDHEMQPDARWQKTIPLAGDVTYTKLVELTEQLSRGDFVELLRRAGFTGSPNRADAAAPVPERVEAQLAEMVLSEQYSALRELHASIRASGESPARLGALVRGYANLGVLTRFHWNSSHKVFKARALLYAQRMVAADPQSPAPLWHRAYARAMTGLHGAALDDLAAAGRLAAQIVRDKPEASMPAPQWLSFVDAFCRYDTNRLKTASDSHTRHSQLALLLSFLALEYSDSYRLTVDRGQSVLERVPECFCVDDMLCEMGGLDLLHQLTVQAPTVFADTLPKRLAAMVDLPAGATRILKAGRSGGFLGRLLGGNSQHEIPRADLVRALVDSAGDAGDRAEPSWAVLGRLIEETTFSQIRRRGHFMRYSWSVPVDDFLREALPLIPDHPYRGLIESYAFDSSRQTEQYRTATKDLSFVDVDLDMVSAIRSTWKAPAGDRIQGQPAWRLAWRHADKVAEDVYLQYWNTSEKDRVNYARELLKISPHSPLAMAGLIHWDWAYAEPRAAEWEEKYSYYPVIPAALGKRYTDLKRYADAERCLKKAIALCPDRWCFEALAATYWYRDDKDKWRETLEDFLRQPDSGLAHAGVQVKLARYFMGEKQWDKAAPYAEAAAGTWAGWAMACANECYEGMGEWPKAELWVRRLSERYETSQADWFMWCKRTGHGNVEAARLLAERRFQSIEQRATTEDLHNIGAFYVLTERPKKAIEYFQRVFGQAYDPGPGLNIVILADQSGDTATRDAALKTIEEKGPSFKFDQNGPRKQMIALAAMFRKCLAAGPGGRLDLKAVDDLLASADEAERTNLQYFVGRFLELHGQAQQGRVYLQRCADSTVTVKLTHVLARDWLRRESNR